MSKKIIWLLVSSLMALSLVIAACTPTTPTTPATPTTPTAPTTPASPTTPTTPGEEKTQKEVVKPSGEVPKYGGTVVHAETNSVSNWNEGQVVSYNILYTPIWGANWTKGAAGGYGTNESDWVSQYDVQDHYAGWAAESWKWTLDAKTGEVTVVYPIRRGLHYHLIPGNEASRLVNGREMTADDVVFTMRRLITPDSSIYFQVPELRTANITKTGPWEVTLKLPKPENLMPAFTNLNGKYLMIRPPEVFEKNGNIDKWQLQIGTGSFMLKDYVPASQATLIRNPTFWDKDPIGPGKGNQLPYLDGITYLIVPDLSTQYAALRTGKIDFKNLLNWEDASQMRKTSPQILQYKHWNWTSVPSPVVFRMDIPPFNDVRVRRALLLATDLETIRQTWTGGLGTIITYPFMYNPPYADLYIGLDSQDLPKEVKDLYTYNLEKAKQLLKEAGYPNGFKTQVLAATTDADYLSIIKDMWSKAGVELEFMIRDSATRTNLITNKTNPPVNMGGATPPARFYQPWGLTGTSTQNPGMIYDPVIEKGLDPIRTLAMTDLRGAMKLMRELSKTYILSQAFAIPTPSAPMYNLWWPWIKNYNGQSAMLLGTSHRWLEWAWLDQDLKKSMGY